MRHWYLISHTYNGGVQYGTEHWLETVWSPQTACGQRVGGAFTQHFPKKRPPKCATCRRARAGKERR